MQKRKKNQVHACMNIGDASSFYRAKPVSESERSGGERALRSGIWCGGERTAEQNTERSGGELHCGAEYSAEPEAAHRKYNIRK